MKMDMMLYRKYKLLWLGLTIVLLAAAATGTWLFLHDDLRSINITSPLPYRPEWEISPLTEQEIIKINEIFEQPLSYLSEGGQSSVFSSADNHYVLKLFKFRRFRPSKFVNFLPDISLFSAYRNKHLAKREKGLIAPFTGHKLAYDLLQHESGLIFIQLNASHSPRPVTLIDKRGFKRYVDLGNATFVIQEKGVILSDELSRLLDQRDLVAAKMRIRQLFDLYVSEYRKGIYDLDHGLMHNIGCVENRLIHLDVGKLIHDSRMKNPEFYRIDLAKKAAKVRSWINTKYPQYNQELLQDMEDKLSLDSSS